MPLDKYIAYAISQWKPANDGDTWEKIDRTWGILYALVEIAAQRQALETN